MLSYRHCVSCRQSCRYFKTCSDQFIDRPAETKKTNHFVISTPILVAAVTILTGEWANKKPNISMVLPASGRNAKMAWR